jgi:hypothetical protein
MACLYKGKNYDTGFSKTVRIAIAGLLKQKVFAKN